MTETAYLAPETFERELRYELESEFKRDIVAQYDRLIVASGAPAPVAWCENIWKEPRRLSVRSISDAARQLRELAPRWTLFPYQHHRRATLIHEQVPRARGLEIEFLSALPKSNPASFLLLSPDSILASAHCTSPFANGELLFKGDPSAPSRAYLKLWELFTVHKLKPRPGSYCLDLGSSPGGWTWVLQAIGAHVTSVDKAPLDPKVAALPRVEYRRHDAFTLKPEALERVDWVFSDIICEPKRLWDLVQNWRESRHSPGFVCTLKFKGETDHGTTRLFREVPTSHLMHLHHNKHELTWVLPPRDQTDKDTP